MEERSLPSRAPTALPGRPESQTNLADILERVLDKGIVIAGDIQINLLDIELLTIKLRLLIASVDRAREMGINWWESDPSLQKLEPGDNGDASALLEPRTASFASVSSGSSGSSAWARRTAMADEIDRWAAERGPDVLARAEAEAVAVLRDALVEAAIARRETTEEAPDRRPAARAPRRGAGEAATGAVGLRRARRRRGDPAHADSPASTRHAGRTRARPATSPCSSAACRSRSSATSRCASNLNDLDWLERVARAHEAVLDQALAGEHACAAAPVHDLRERGRRARDARTRARGLRPCPRASRRAAGVGGQAAGRPRDARGGGARRSDDIAELESDVEGAQRGRRVHAAAPDRAPGARPGRRAGRRGRRGRARPARGATPIDAVSRPPQNRDLSGHEGEMLLNGAYLVEDERVDGLRDLVAELEQRHRALGARLDLSGPWPPYNFVPGDAGTDRMTTSIADARGRADRPRRPPARRWRRHRRRHHARGGRRRSRLRRAARAGHLGGDRGGEGPPPALGSGL